MTRRRFIAQIINQRPDSACEYSRFSQSHFSLNVASMFSSRHRLLFVSIWTEKYDRAQFTLTLLDTRTWGNTSRERGKYRSQPLEGFSGGSLEE
jgi:hypothetical protein